jgi:hypothetical protein
MFAYMITNNAQVMVPFRPIERQQPPPSMAEQPEQWSREELLGVPGGA